MFPSRNSRGPAQADYLLIESTADKLAAVGCALPLLRQIHRLATDSGIRNLPAYLNSPMAADVTTLYERFSCVQRLSRDDCRAMGPTGTLFVEFAARQVLDRSAARWRRLAVANRFGDLMIAVNA